jgi:LytS/YehU family sensor histidine kinase
MLLTEFMGWIPVSLLSYAMLVGVGAALVLAGDAAATARRAAQLEGALATAQLAALRAQIQPHFVFNVLNTIGVFVREGDRPRALRTIDLFGNALRTVLRTESTHLVPLADELAALRHYVEIEETRYEDRVSVHWCIDPALAGHAVPALIYQPVVENAFRHGVGRRLGASVVEIGARMDGDGLTLWVRESGAAPDGTVRPAAAGGDESGGIGLSNTAARLAALYGLAGQLVLRTDADASVAEIHIPRARAPS